MDALVRLAANAVPNERKYVLLAGAGLSKDAGQRTAWDIVLETAKLLRAVEGGDESTPVDQWFAASTYAQRSYADMVSALYPNPAEQQSFLQRQLTVRIPGRAHEAIAELCSRGVLRAIITTNFDPLIEQALRARGIEPQVIATETDFADVSPLIHCDTIRLYKPHGTLGNGPLRNTPADVATLPAAVAEELRRVCDDHGLIIIGYAGSDPGLMNVLQNRRRTLFPVYWLHLEDAPPAAAVAACGQSVVGVKITGASSALESLLAIQDRLARLSSTRALIDPTPTIDAIKRAGRDVKARVRDFMSEVAKSISRLSPHGADLNPRGNPDCDEVFLQALEATKPLMLEYWKVASTASEHESSDACCSLREELHRLQRLYRSNPPLADEDFVSFLRQEMFLVIVASLLKNERWDSLASILTGTYFDDKGQPARWEDFNAYISILDDYRKNFRKLSRHSVASDIYRLRYTEVGPLVDALPFVELEDADWFLTFVTGFTHEPGVPDGDKWLPRFSLGTERMPVWLAKMRSRKYAYHVLSLIDVGDSQRRQDQGAIERFFIENLAVVANMNRRVWSGVRSPGDLERGFGEELFKLP